MTKFTDWLESELTARNMSPADFARAMRKDQSIISRILRGEREPRPETLNTIAHALRLPIEIVFRQAGILPPKPSKNELVERAEHLYGLLNPGNQRKALEYLEFLNIQEERGDYRVTKTKTVEPG